MLHCLFHLLISVPGPPRLTPSSCPHPPRIWTPTPPPSNVNTLRIVKYPTTKSNNLSHITPLTQTRPHVLTLHPAAKSHPRGPVNRHTAFNTVSTPTSIPANFSTSDSKPPLVVCLSSFTHTRCFIQLAKVATLVHASICQKMMIKGTLKITHGGYRVRFEVTYLDNLSQTSESVTSLGD